MKQAIVDKNAAVSSAALVSSLHLSRYNTGTSFLARTFFEFFSSQTPQVLFMRCRAVSLLAAPVPCLPIFGTIFASPIVRGQLKTMICYLYRTAGEVVKLWVNEVQESIRKEKKNQLILLP